MILQIFARYSIAILHRRPLKRVQYFRGRHFIIGWLRKEGLDEWFDFGGEMLEEHFIFSDIGLKEYLTRK